MLTYLRDTLAIVCFAASVGCLALWGWSLKYPRHSLDAGLMTKSIELRVSLWDVVTDVSITAPLAGNTPRAIWYEIEFSNDERIDRWGGHKFGGRRHSLYFPIWYAALILALAGVGVLRFRRQFSIRSALICVSVVALLLGIVVAL